jgi:hypothetical protein
MTYSNDYRRFSHCRCTILCRTSKFLSQSARCWRGVEGFLEQRDNNHRIKLYIGYDGNQRKYLFHEVKREFIHTVGINGNQSLGINKPESSSFWCEGWDSNPRRPSPEIPIRGPLRSFQRKALSWGCLF